MPNKITLRTTIPSSNHFASLSVFRGVIAALALLVAAGTLFPHARLWGVHFMAYLPTAGQIGFILLAVLAFVFSFFSARLESFFKRFRIATGRPLLTDLGLAFVCGLGFYAFAMAVPLLGDGQLWVDELATETPDIWIQRGPLTVVVLDQANRIMNALFGTSIQDMFRVISSLCGVIAVFSWLRWARASGAGTVAGLVWGFAWGGTALYFGYAELYIIMAAVMSAAFSLLLISLRRGQMNWAVPLLAGFAVSFNYIALTFWPGIAAYLWWGVTQKTLRAKWVFSGAVVLFALAAAAYFVKGWYLGTFVLLPFWPIPSSVGGSVFDLRHLTDMANGLLLSAGPFIALLITYLTAMRRHWSWTNERLILSLLFLFPFAAYMMHNSHLGMARDWDIGATLMLAVPFASIWLWSEAPFARIRTSGLALTFVWLFAVTIPWFTVQASESRAMNRFADLLRLDPERSANGWDYLGAFYRLRDKPDDWARCYREALKHSDNPRYHYNLSINHILNREWELAQKEIQEVRRGVYADSVITSWESWLIDPSKMIEIGQGYEELAGPEFARQTYRLASELNPESPHPPLAMTRMIVRLLELEQAEQMYRMILSQDARILAAEKAYYRNLPTGNSATMQILSYSGLALLARIEGHDHEARDYLNKALSASGNNPQIEKYRQVERQ